MSEILQRFGTNAVDNQWQSCLCINWNFQLSAVTFVFGVLATRIYTSLSTQDSELSQGLKTWDILGFGRSRGPPGSLRFAERFAKITMCGFWLVGLFENAAPGTPMTQSQYMYKCSNILRQFVSHFSHSVPWVWLVSFMFPTDFQLFSHASHTFPSFSPQNKCHFGVYLWHFSGLVEGPFEHSSGTGAAGDTNGTSLVGHCW
jgi:hypothetical protein